MFPYGGSSAPPTYLLCDGAAVSRTTFAALFAVIGTTFGSGDGSTTFNVPFMARRTVVGAGGTGSAVLGNAVGNTGGAESVALTSAQNGDHTHATIPGLGINQISISGGSGHPFTFKSGIAVTNTGGVNGGAGQPHNNIQPSLVMNWIIKT
jgi:microcystin-dependent protein